MVDKVRILLADDHRNIRISLALLLKQDKRFDVVGEASNGMMAVELARKLLPDVVIMDARMPELDGVEATRLIVSDQPGITVIGFSTFSDSRLNAEMKKAGALVCISKNAPIQALIETIHTCRI